MLSKRFCDSLTSTHHFVFFRLWLRSTMVGLSRCPEETAASFAFFHRVWFEVWRQRAKRFKMYDAKSFSEVLVGSNSCFLKFLSGSYPMRWADLRFGSFIFRSFSRFQIFVHNKWPSINRKFPKASGGVELCTSIMDSTPLFFGTGNVKRRGRGI